MKKRLQLTQPQLQPQSDCLPASPFWILIGNWFHIHTPSHLSILFWLSTCEEGIISHDVIFWALYTFWDTITRGVHPPKSMMHIVYFQKIYKFPPILAKIINSHLFSFNLGFLLNLYFFLPPILRLMHLSFTCTGRPWQLQCWCLQLQFVLSVHRQMCLFPGSLAVFVCWDNPKIFMWRLDELSKRPFVWTGLSPCVLRTCWHQILSTITIIYNLQCSVFIKWIVPGFKQCNIIQCKHIVWYLWPPDSCLRWYTLLMSYRSVSTCLLTWSPISKGSFTYPIFVR